MNPKVIEEKLKGYLTDSKKTPAGGNKKQGKRLAA